MRATVNHDLLDRAAIFASAVCLVHCLALPLLLAALPALGHIFNLSDDLHIWILAFALPTSGYALVSGRARHGAALPLFVGATGLSLMALGTLWFGSTAAETPVTIFGSVTLASAHIMNWRLRHRHCRCVDAGPDHTIAHLPATAKTGR